MKIIQALIVLFAVIGCLALALGGFFIYNMSQNGGDNFLSRLKKSKSAQTADTGTSAPVAAKDSQYAAIIQQYRPTPTPTPVPQVAAPGAPVATAPGAPVRVAAAVATPTVKPIKTPKPDEGKIRSWPSGKKWVALTYDDGPHREWTPKMIELLKSKNVKATFFLLGQEIERYPDIAKSIADNGFEIGNHTMNHPDFNKSSMTPDKIREQLQGTNDLIAEYVTRKPIRVMRPPFGNTPKKLVEICTDMGLQIVCWNIDTNDWESKTEAKDMVENIMKNLSDGSIILMHDKHQKTYDTTAEVIDKIRAEGYEFVTMSELLGLEPLNTAPVAAATPAVASAPTGLPAPVAAPMVPAAATEASLPPVAAGAGGSGASALPVPSSATGTPGKPTSEVLDASKITEPPPQR